MIPLLTSPEMQEVDRITIQELGLPGLVLMEAAAAAVTDVVTDRFDEAGPVVVVCGPGNNGGDGLAVARQLHCRGFEVRAVLLVPEASLKGDARKQLELARAFQAPVETVPGESLDALTEALSGAGVVVDALFGTGLARPLEGRWAEVVGRVNACAAPVVAVDVPSGLLGSSAAVPGPCVEAVITVTFAAPKLPHALPPACWRCGEVAVGDIGIPPWIVAARSGLALLEREDVGGWLPGRPVDAHKGQFGHLLVVGGRLGRAGAAALAARAAVIGGAGLVTVATPTGAVAPIQSLVPEAMVDPLPAGPDGAASGEGLVGSLERATALAVGPGLGTGRGAGTLVAEVLRLWHGPLVLDADALNLVAGRLEALASRAEDTVLTPHPAELARLLGWSTERVVADRLAAARDAARISGGVVLCKGARTVIAGGPGPDLVNPTGSPGLASGGSGDVLTGLVGALLAQGLSAREAAAAGAWLHGRAAELAGSGRPGSIPAGVLVDHLAAAEAEARGRTV